MIPLSIELYATVLMVQTVWRESRGEPFEGQVAVAYNILERADNPSWWGGLDRNKDPLPTRAERIISVIKKFRQYSSMTAPGDPQLILYPEGNDPKFESAYRAVMAALNRLVPNPAPRADHYYSVSIEPPDWATPEKKVAKIGRHVFYNLQGGS